MNNTTILSDCFSAQTIPGHYKNNELNPDVGGFAVGLSNIVINIVLPILLRWAHDDVQTTVVMLLSQVYPIMIATAGSINSTNLSLFDAHFAVAVTASPISVYLVYSAFRDFLGHHNSLFENLRTGKTIIRYLSLALPFLWLGINLTISFSPRAFKNSPDYCRGMTFTRWFEFQAVSNFIGVLDVMGRRDIWNDLQGRGGLGAIALASMWVWAIYIVRHRYDILDELVYRKERQSKRSTLAKIWYRVWNIPAASWFVVTTSHPWMIFVIIMCLHWSWVLGIAKGMTSSQQYELSYGQIMSLFSTVPPILALCKLLNLRYRNLVDFMKTLPFQFCVGAKFLLMGSPNPWDFYEAHGELPRRLVAVWPLDQVWSIVVALWLGFTSLDAWWVYWYVRSGSMPNPRTKVNDPHRAWKPFSVAMYTYGYCICYVNIYIWTVFYDGNYSLTGKFGSWLSCLRETLSHRQRNLLRALKFMIIPLAFVMCCGGLFIPFAALPLAQQYQWSRFCERYPFEGEVILTGATNPGLKSTATFFYSGSSTFRERYFDYSIVPNETFSLQTLIFNPKTSPSPNRPQVVSVAYNTSEQSFEARCTVSQNASMTALCAFGTWTKKKYLSFRIQDAHNNSITYLRTVDEEWEFSDDAPSLVLKHQGFDNTNDLGGVVLQTAVTQRNYCYRLKTCLASPEADVATVVPLGVILLTQQTFAGYCTRPRIYAL
ncbi:unnamed protein product [Cyclocybe aegerita]|uniref:Uncharacterized protein n=1 Tax=Cyclocybe aegerita TaxID=1973307 RepID=A0A8S0VQB0_CYCAE|nr:unnamed protein product [Cyclocybe aegerita]